MSKLETAIVIKADVQGVSRVHALADGIKHANQRITDSKAPSDTAKKAIDELGKELQETTTHAHKAKGGMAGFADSVKHAQADIGKFKNALSGLSGVLAALGVSVGAKELLDMAESFKSLEARVKLATDEGVAPFSIFWCWL